MGNKQEAKTVLIIEDDADIQNFTARVLELEGYQVLTASNGEAGMEIVRRHHLDIVVLDLRLPGRDGWSVLSEIKHDATLAKIPVIVISAVAETVQQERTLRMGATRYIIKPMSAHRLAMAITNALHQDDGHRHTAVKKANTAV